MEIEKMVAMHGITSITTGLMLQRAHVAKQVQR